MTFAVHGAATRLLPFVGLHCVFCSCGVTVCRHEEISAEQSPRSRALWLQIARKISGYGSLLFLYQKFAVSFILILILLFLFHSCISEALKPDSIATLE